MSTATRRVRALLTDQQYLSLVLRRQAAAHLELRTCVLGRGDVLPQATSFVAQSGFTQPYNAHAPKNLSDAALPKYGTPAGYSSVCVRWSSSCWRLKQSYDAYIYIACTVRSPRQCITIYHALNFSRIHSLKYSQVSEAPTVGQSWLVHLREKGEGQGGAGRGTHIHREGPNSLHRSKHSSFNYF